MPEIAENRPTPWLGVFERVTADTTFLWTLVLALTLLHRTAARRSP